MSIINCKECSHEISSNAKNCPYCGYSEPSPSGCSKFMAMLIFIIAGITILSLFSD